MNILEGEKFRKPEIHIVELQVPEPDLIKLELPYVIRGTYTRMNTRTQDQSQNCIKDSDRFKRYRNK